MAELSPGHSGPSTSSPLCCDESGAQTQVSSSTQLTTIPVALRLLSGIQEALSWGGPPSHRALPLSALASLADVLALAEEPLSPGDPGTRGLACAPIARAVAVLALRQLSRR